MSFSLLDLRTANIFTSCILTNSEAVAQLANDPIMSGRSRQFFRHLEYKKPVYNFRFYYFIDKGRIGEQLWQQNGRTPCYYFIIENI